MREKQKTVGKLRIVCRGPKQTVNTLNGGNQQKVVLGKWLTAMPRLLNLDEPTRGLDVGTKAEIYEIIDLLASEGVTIVMISSELPEMINMSDRIYVMRSGTISAEMTDPECFTQENILSHTLQRAILSLTFGYAIMNE